MRLLANILWHFPFCGFITAAGCWLLGGLLTVTVMAAPIGMGLMQMAKFLLAPFSYSMISKSQLTQDQNKAWRAYGIVVTILYLPFGIALFIANIFQIILLCCSIVGIPMAVILAKSCSTLLNPVNKICVPRSVTKELEIRKAKEFVDKYQK